MGKAVETENLLGNEVASLRKRYPKLARDELFILWFLRAYVTENEEQAANALCGGPGDKGCDAVFIDETTKVVFLVQGKYRAGIGARPEKRADIVSFADLVPAISGDSSSFAALREGASPNAVKKHTAARKRVKERGYAIHAYYVTTGKVSGSVADQAELIVQNSDCESIFRAIAGRDLTLIIEDYLDGVAPPIPSLDLDIEAGHGIQMDNILHRFDKRTHIESWVFPMSGGAIVDLHDKAGLRLFARNIRGFLGESTYVNDDMKYTLNHEPEYFWYYNNGITIICEEARQITTEGRKVLRVANPQVINGQQTTVTLARNRDRAKKASVVVRVICVPRRSVEVDVEFDELVSEIVEATNNQNAIRPSDLRSNDRIQVELERRLRPLGYHYIRKRQAKNEAKGLLGGAYSFQITKTEFARAVAACDLDPYYARAGVENLFEDDMYGAIFPRVETGYYLSRYWLMKQVNHVSWGIPQRGYAKWLVLHHVWQDLSELLGSRTAAEHFRRTCEEGESEETPEIRSLRKAADTCFNGVMGFFRANRGKGKKAQDVSNFFYHRGLYDGFERFWRSSKNRKYRAAYAKRRKRFVARFRSEME